MDTYKMLRVIKRHTLEAIFQVMRVVVKKIVAKGKNS